MVYCCAEESNVEKCPETGEPVCRDGIDGYTCKMLKLKYESEARNKEKHTFL